MLKGIKFYILSIVFASLFFIPQMSFAQPYVCFPSCSAVDGRFLVVAGPDRRTIVGAEIVVNLVSNGDELEFGVFDGEAGENWDVATVGNMLHLKYELHADPEGDSSGLMGPVLATWTGDGSGGLNAGTPMNNNGWSDFNFPHVPEAQAENGDFIYTMRITPIALVDGTESVFKIRTVGNIYVPAMFPVSFIGGFGGNESFNFFLEDLEIIYPEAFFIGFDLCGMPGGCNRLIDPGCCTVTTNYDGTWSFFMVVPQGETALDVWDGDFDFGDYLATLVDTNDPNTPGDPFIPDWSIGTDVEFEGAAGALPPDDLDPGPTALTTRPPNVFYNVIDSLGTQYLNDNPSGDVEWELFRMDTMTDDPAIAEYQAAGIPQGLWEVRIEGLDLSNLNSLVLPYDILGFDENGDPVLPPEPPLPPRNVPTLNEWGLIAMAVIFGIVGYMVIRRREVPV